MQAWHFEASEAIQDEQIRYRAQSLGEIDMQAPHARSAIQVIIREHQQLSTVIAGMQRFVELLGAGAKTPGPMVFRAMLYYIREYPERIHHPKEDQYLFARLWHRTRELDEVIADL